MRLVAGATAAFVVMAPAMGAESISHTYDARACPGQVARSANGVSTTCEYDKADKTGGREWH